MCTSLDEVNCARSYLTVSFRVLIRPGRICTSFSMIDSACRLIFRVPAVRLYADAANAKTKLENGFDLTNYDERTLAFAKDYSNQLLAIDVNLDTTEMLDVAWSLFGKYFRPEEVNIKKELVDQYWPTN